MGDREDLANSRFSCSERERAVFEAGIKLATVYHQFVGTPVNLDSVKELEDTIARSIEVQPYVESATISIDRSYFTKDGDTYSYVSLTGDMIDAIVIISLGDTKVTAEMRFDKELNYPLMFVSKIE
ncbi:MAG: dihydroneopterin aldolase family protein [Candidatus Methanomethylophilaceae archaeon]|nr:dihydroneopterin aldolase family protein [Candidatus Methanomethylophilaceae archaeon]